MGGCLSRVPTWGPGPQPRHVPWLGIEPATLWFAGWHSIHWATPARACCATFYHSTRIAFSKNGPELETLVLSNTQIGENITNKVGSAPLSSRVRTESCHPLQTKTMPQQGQGGERASKNITQLSIASNVAFCWLGICLVAADLCVSTAHTRLL